MPDPAAINSMFSRIAGRYDLGNRVLSGGLDSWWRHQLVQSLVKTGPAVVLDLACGSGDVAFAISRKTLPTIKITGVDFCQPMLDEAITKQKADPCNRYGNVVFQQGDGLNLPFPDHFFDAVSIAFGLRNMGDRARSLAEIYRVLRPGGRMFILEFSQPNRWFRPFYLFYLRHILPWVAGLLCRDRSAYVYLNESIEAFPHRDALTVEIRAAGFSAIKSRGMTFGTVALHEAAK
jgi:demethylmenaquinone methyltransferase/2-methoxy-6-polyprenyl-1,4-benzoquinol methylase